MNTDFVLWLNEEAMRRGGTDDPCFEGSRDIKRQLVQEWLDRKEDWQIEVARQHSNPRAMVYFAQEEQAGAIKIGTSFNVPSRICALQKGI